MATRNASKNSALKHTPSEASTRRRHRRLQKELSNHGDYFAREAEAKRRQADMKRLCADLLRANGYAVEAREIATEAREIGRSAWRCARIGKDCTSKAQTLATRLAA
jgi:hypothetical protein